MASSSSSGAYAPHAPWALRGEVVAAVVGGRHRSLVGAGGVGNAGDVGARLPAGVRPLPGPAVALGVRYTDSPVGAYLELSVWEPARLGLRPGWCVSAMVVSEAAAKVGCRLNWGLPAQLGELEWSAEGDVRVVRWAEGGVVLRAVPRGRVVLPVVLPMRSVQERSDGPVLVPRRLGALLRRARVEVAVEPGGEEGLSWLAGVHGGAVLSAARLVVRPARHPSGVLSSFRAPSRAAEPRLSYRSKAAAEALE